MNIDKRSGRRFGPPTTKRLIAFLDDMNLPYVETYGTQNAIALLTQIVGYGTFFDRADLGFRKEVLTDTYNRCPVFKLLLIAHTTVLTRKIVRMTCPVTQTATVVSGV